jgi:hypothetical protein
MTNTAEKITKKRVYNILILLHANWHKRYDRCARTDFITNLVLAVLGYISYLSKDCGG